MVRDRAWTSSLFLPVLGGVLLSFAYPRIDFWPLAYCALVPLFIFLDSAATRRMALMGSFLFSFMFFAISVHWIRFVTLFGWAFVAFWESLFFMVMGYLMWSLLHRCSCKVCFTANLSLLVTLPALWVLAEWVRSEIPVMGFGWNLLGYSQAENLPLLQAAKITGVYGVSFLVAFANAFLFLLWRLLLAQGSPLRRFLILGAASIIVSIVFFPVLRSGEAMLREESGGPVFRVSVIQGNIPQEEKWDPKYQKVILDKFFKMSELAGYDGPDLIVWPEAAYPGYYNLSKNEAFTAFVEKLNTPILFGALTALSETLFYNSAYLISPNPDTSELRYDKIRLVPFGEYVPFRSVLSPLDPLARSLGVGDFSAGTEIQLFPISLPAIQTKQAGRDEKSEAAVGPLICFENIFLGGVRALCWKGANILCVITNDAWFQDSSAPYQHLGASIFRAVETGRWVIHCANTGVSAFISPQGRVVDRVKNSKDQDLFVAGAVTRPVTLYGKNTPYLSFGYLFPYITLLIVIQGFVFSIRKQYKQHKQNKQMQTIS
ncbi:MAG: apolipoprotein N-acyltransferase [Candidatus Omnitrophica bacterium]|nr:apolipoprotein N-acyltransferase [Candidatus Omnitrophota bacterium]